MRENLTSLCFIPIGYFIKEFYFRLSKRSLKYRPNHNARGSVTLFISRMVLPLERRQPSISSYLPMSNSCLWCSAAKLQGNFLITKCFSLFLYEQIFGKQKNSQVLERTCEFFVSGGAGGIRTLVRTRKPYAFYMLIPAFGFRGMTGPGPPIIPLSSKISSMQRGVHELFPIYLHRLINKIRNNIRWAMSRSSTLCWNKASLLYFD